MSIIGSNTLLRAWWALPMAALLSWGLSERAAKVEARADLAAEQAAHRQSALGWQLATAMATALDLANKIAVERRQAEESRRIADDFEARIADARARAAASGVRGQAAAADQGGRGSAPVPGVPDTARGADAPACQAGLSPADALIATEQAIQLDELINWVITQSRIPREGADQ